MLQKSSTAEGSVTGAEVQLGSFEAMARHCANESATKLANGTVTIATADGDEFHGAKRDRSSRSRTGHCV